VSAVTGLPADCAGIVKNRTIGKAETPEFERNRGAGSVVRPANDARISIVTLQSSGYEPSRDEPAHPGAGYSIGDSPHAHAAELHRDPAI
jgi:hypothetical protein